MFYNSDQYLQYLREGVVYFLFEISFLDKEKREWPTIYGNWTENVAMLRNLLGLIWELKRVNDL